VTARNHLGLYIHTVMGALKMTDVKMTDMKLTDQMTGHEIARHENAGHETAGHKSAGYEKCRRLKQSGLNSPTSVLSTPWTRRYEL